MGCSFAHAPFIRTWHKVLKCGHLVEVLSIAATREASAVEAEDSCNLVISFDPRCSKAVKAP